MRTQVISEQEKEEDTSVGVDRKKPYFPYREYSVSPDLTAFNFPIHYSDNESEIMFT